MSIAIVAPFKEVSDWVRTFQKLDPSLKLEVYPDIARPEEVETVVVWQHPHGILMEYPNLRLICSMGSGVDHIVADPNLPEGVPVTRIVDPRLTYSMTNYVIMGILNYHRQFTRYQEYKISRTWDMSDPEIDVSVGVMGTGQLGGDVLDKLKAIGIPAFGYGNSPKPEFRHPYFYGDQLDTFLEKVNVVVCLLPLTEKTEGFLNKDLFSRFTPGTYLINVARGKHLIEEDLMEALSEGWVSGALLDVFRQEPLPENHPFWNHPKIMITPHIACITMYEAAVPQILDNHRRRRGNQPLSNQIDVNQGY
ncbi:D-3-phosphoglycerate dehydrogenase [Lunatimonas lonarensis]|uniref:D-3-phosphoglycerate dehydrogenase n=1 Tax=Lunatimonas lonarensis TaxID=1232681 RepID=R7ZRQ2_9BACT|nr:glyoxylate/hydroxypyruvate reductase A [Lunatimonas lonarensis]EON76728.1 D-3-phosphoglycerate dehydrogenase [Lunatimonas lonarensis]